MSAPNSGPMIPLTSSTQRLNMGNLVKGIARAHVHLKEATTSGPPVEETVDEPAAAAPQQPAGRRSLADMIREQAQPRSRPVAAPAYKPQNPPRPVQEVSNPAPRPQKRPPLQPRAGKAPLSGASLAAAALSRMRR